MKYVDDGCYGYYTSGNEIENIHGLRDGGV
jgi:hypothetical protein